MVDVNEQLDAVIRGVQAAEKDGELTRVQTLAQVYPSPIADVWDAATDGDRIARWFLPVEGDLRLGGRYQLVGNAGGVVEECSPPAAGAAGYRVTWEYGGGVSWLEVALSSVDTDSTRFELTHIARAADLPEGFWELYGPGATGVGWDQGLLGLALHLRGDGQIPPDAAEAWMLSDEGMRFARGAADSWAAAQIAAGDDPEGARSAADATYMFYTGQTPTEMPEH
ncbi:Activator of Hsp90 ATPase homolog 1-like protein [Microbacterium sp. cf046]|uniref:SRPBCC domain-containing protein n=1 Tax=Microbacterium sp. cf046 TaxID=1761803 RepID=UPI0008DF1D82|nr:SRPBCC domain-containing protein [Microbacterium sp. cf046]SFS15246.1 Activator of Hsp90 ATPase homolog 1-like protein [Microbacterium sp. cf046]